MNKPKLGEGATPGPWTPCYAFETETGFEAKIISDETVIAIAVHKDQIECEANARLIAKVKLLVEARDFLLKLAMTGHEHGLGDCYFCKARALLAKLEG